MIALHERDYCAYYHNYGQFGPTMGNTICKVQHMHISSPRLLPGAVKRECLLDKRPGDFHHLVVVSPATSGSLHLIGHGVEHRGSSGFGCFSLSLSLAAKVGNIPGSCLIDASCSSGAKKRNVILVIAV